MKNLFKSIYIYTVLLLSNTVFSQTNPYVYMQDGKLMEACEQFYPVVCNYLADINIDTSGNIYAAPDFHYNFTSCNDYADCSLNLRNNFLKIDSMGFNTVRIMGLSVIGAPSLSTTELAIRINDNYKVLLSSYYNNYIALIEDVLDIAADCNLKVIWVAGRDSVEDVIYRNYYKTFLGNLAYHFRNNSTLIAYDLLNEPYYSRLHLNHEKPEIYQIVADWYAAIRSNTSNQLVTIGLCHDNDVFRWDPAIMSVDFQSFHVYPWVYSSSIPSQIHYDPDRKFEKSKFKWMSLTSTKPWMIGETGFSGIPQFVMDTTPNWNISLHPYVHGTEYNQADYAYFSLHRTKACGAIGYSWWLNKDIHWYERGHLDEQQNYFGLIDSRAPGNVNKAAIDTFQTYLYQNCNDNCNIDSLVYTNPLNYPILKVNGRVIDAFNNGIGNAVIYAWNNDGAIYSTFSEFNGNFSFKWDFSTVSLLKISYPGKNVQIFNYPSSNIGNVVLSDLPSNQMPQASFDNFKIATGTTVSWTDNVSINKNLIIESNASLTVNADVFLNDYSQIIVEPGATLILQNGSSLTGMCSSDKWQGLLHVKENAELLVMGGSTIRMGGTGTIFIDSTNSQTGQLTFMNNANIILTDYTTKLEIKGKLRLMPQAHFFTQGRGYVRFSSTLSDSQCYNIFAQSNTSMTFNGEGQNHKKLEIAQNSLYLHDVKYITITNTKVVMEGSISRLSLNYTTGGSITVNNILITSSTGNRTSHRGIALYGRSNTSIQNSVFSNGMYGILAMLNYTDGAPLTLTNCTFSNNTRGLNVNDKGITLNYCTFTNNDYGVYADGMTFSSSVNTSTLNYNSDGIKYTSASTGGLYVYNPVIRYNYNGINYSGATKLTVRCGQIKNNSYGINFMSSASLNMSQNESPTGGKVNMSSNTELNISSNYGNLLFLNSGYNNLQRSPNKQVINGILTGYDYCPKNLAVQSNRWNASNTSPVSGTDYALNDDNSFCRPGGSVISLIDNSPTYGICSIPSGFSSGQDNTFSTSSPIYTPNYNNVSLSFALSNAVSLIESGNYYVAADRLYEILNYPLLSTSAADNYYLNKAYLYMKQNMASIFQNLISDTTTVGQNTLANYTNKLRLIQNKIISQTQNDTSAYNHYYYTSLDKALLYRAVYQYNNALSQLNNILLWVKTANIDEVNKWLCLTQLEKDVLDSIVRKEDFFELKQLCESNMSLKIAPNSTNGSSQNDTLQNENEILNTNLLVQERAYINVTPNPVTNQSVIETFIPEFEKQSVIKVLDMLGRTVSTLHVTTAHSSITISNSSLKEGIYYFVLINDDVILDKVRVVFIKE